MPVTTPPAIIEPAQSPLMSELIKRAAATTPLDSPAQPSQPDHASAKWPMLAAAGGDAADILSTNWGLRHGGHEINPLLSSNPTKNALEQMAADAGIQFLIHKLNNNHPTLAKLLGYGDAAFGAGGTMMSLAHKPSETPLQAPNSRPFNTSK